MVRLGLSTDKPLAVQQWQGLIAINYPAREFGLTRHITITEAKKLCPDLIMQHVATWREGDEKWAYHEDAFKNIATHKVSLDPYRLESRRILAVIKDHLPAAPISKVEKASVDEVFLDLSAQVHGKLLEQYPMLRGPAPYDDSTEPLPRPPTTALEWKTDALVDLDAQETEDDDPDWDDIVMLVASEIVRDVRAVIYEKLKYTCSAGIAKNKMLAKLGSAHKKPNQQTIIRNRAIQQFLSGFKFTKIRNLGGKLGDEIVAAFDTDTVSDLLKVSVDQLKKQLGDDTGTWLYSIIRGEDYSEVNPRTQIKSMLSAKSFRPSINTLEIATRWLRIFVADIFSRLVEEGVLENKRRPKTMNLHHKQGTQSRSKSAPIPLGRTIDEALLVDIAKTLLAQVVADGRAWPCSNLSLSVAGFEDGITGNMGISGFLVRGEEAKTIASAAGGASESRRAEMASPVSKRRKVDDKGIQRFFGMQIMRKESTSDADMEEPEGCRSTELESESAEGAFALPPSAQAPAGEFSPSGVNTGEPAIDNDAAEHDLAEQYTCSRCSISLPVADQGEHDDWHFAKDLQAEDRTSIAVGAPPPRGKPEATQHRGRGRGRGRPPGSGSKEKGQSKLAFG